MKIHVVAIVLAAVGLSGCFSPRQGATPSRDTPEGTVEMFKVYARRGDPAGEWDILSPGLKQRLSQQAGRTIDLADYSQARQMYRGDPRVRAAENMLQTAIVRKTTPIDANTVSVFVQTSGGPLAKSANLKMVKLSRWQLFVRGQDEPYWGFTNDRNFGAERRPDGSFVIWSRGQPGGPRTENVIPASDVANYTTDAQWYVDDLGGLESQFIQ